MKPANPDAFFPMVRNKIFHGFMSTPQKTGIDSILAAWPDSTDRRIGAYGLATAWWETDFTMQPVVEIGHGRGRWYGKPTGPYGQIYYGRGLVQITGIANYQRADIDLHQAGTLGPNESVVKTPDIALRPEISAPIMVRGMTEGWFGPRIGLYFTRDETNFEGARHNINGSDHAGDIAFAAEIFLAALNAA